MLLTTPTDTRTTVLPDARPWRLRLAERRRLRRLDRLGARLARLDAVDVLLERVGARVQAGWVQDAWFVTTQRGVTRHHVGTLRAEQGRDSTQVCLVAAVAVESLPGSITSPAAQRAIGAMWNVLHGGSAAADWSTPPGITAARAYDLVRWNDAPERTQGDVVALIDASRASIGRSSAALRAELATA